jgi:uncharacterized repeat protein (TIGR03943 family)
MATVTSQRIDRPGRITAWLPTAVWLIWIAAFVWLLDDGRYRAFLQPKFWPLPAIGLLVFVLFLLAWAPAYPRRTFSGDRFNRWVGVGILILPVIYIYSVYGTSLGAHALAGRAVGTGNVFALQEFAGRQSLPEYKPGQKVRLSLLSMKPEAFAGKIITVEGGVYRDQNVPDPYFLMYRFFIFCCAADAVPVWVVVRSPESSLLATESWVRVTGRFTLETINNQSVPMLRADTLEKIPVPPPELRYLYF